MAKKNNIENDYKTLYNEIKYNETKGNYNKSLILIDEYLKYNPENNYILVYKSLILDKLNRYEEALNNLDIVLDKPIIEKKDIMFALSIYASVLFHIGKYDDSIYYYERVVNESDQLELISRANLAKLYVKQERKEDAIKILTIDGFNNMFLNIKKANIYCNYNEYDEALKILETKEYNHLKKKVPHNINPKNIEQEKNYLIGHIYYKKDKQDEALEYLYKALSLKRTKIYYNAYMDIARIYIVKSNLEEALRVCEELKKEKNASGYNKIISSLIDEIYAKIYMRKNDFAKAEEYYQRKKSNEYIKSINLAKLELTKGNFIKAEEYFKELDLDKCTIQRNYDDIHKYILVKFRLGKYDEALALLNKFEDEINNLYVDEIKIDLDRVKLYVKLSKGIKLKDKQTTYTNKQIISYDEDIAIKHIIEHHNNFFDKDKTCIFNENIDINKLFYEVQEKIPKEKGVYNQFFDRYVFKYNNVGFNSNNENINQLLVLTLPNTNNIVTMYPFDGSESIFILDEKEEKNKPKTKRLSQIEKFNKKYANY